MSKPDVGKQKMRVLIACEFSGAVRKEFEALGHEAWSCDLLPSEIPGNHYQGDVRDMLSEHWDLMVAHPPCTRLCNSGVCWLEKRNLWEDMREGAEFFKMLLNAPIEKIAVENPIMHKYAREIIGVKYSQIIQPWQFGHGETKATCLWLKNLPLLQPSNIVSGREQRLHKLPPSPDRWRERSKTFPGIAQAMAQQWGTPCFPTPRVPDVWESTPLQAFSHPETFATPQALSTPPTRG